MADTLEIGLVLPDVLGSNGDNGNALVLRQRARMRDINAEIIPLPLGTPIPESLDLYTIGGSEDSAQVAVAERLIKDGGLTRAAAAGRPILAVCVGFQVLGESFRVGNKFHDGLGLIDATTTPMTDRAAGEVITTPTGAGITAELTAQLTGFENHLGATVLGRGASPLGYLSRGTGNMDNSTFVDGTGVEERVAEGAVQGSVVATYMHGPVLARNPQLADVLLAQALGVPLSELAPLDLPSVEKLREEKLA